MDRPSLEDRQALAFAHIGLTLLACQHFETAVKACVACWFPVETGVAATELDAIRSKLETKSLGRLKSELQRYRTLRPDFDKRLQDVLHRRNHLAHHLASSLDVHCIA